MEAQRPGDVIPVMLLAGALVFVPLVLLLAVRALRNVPPVRRPEPAAHGPRRRAPQRPAARRGNFGKRF